MHDLPLIGFSAGNLERLLTARLVWSGFCPMRMGLYLNSRYEQLSHSYKNKSRRDEVGTVGCCTNWCLCNVKYCAVCHGVIYCLEIKVALEKSSASLKATQNANVKYVHICIFATCMHLTFCIHNRESTTQNTFWWFCILLLLCPNLPMIPPDSHDTYCYVTLICLSFCVRLWLSFNS